MDHSLKGNRYSIHSEETKCFKHTRFKDAPERNKLDSHNGPTLITHEKDSFQVSKDNSHNTDEQERQQAYRLREMKKNSISNKNIRDPDIGLTLSHKISKSFTRKESGFKEQRRNEDDSKKLSGNQEKSKNKERIPTPSTKNTVIVQQRRNEDDSKKLSGNQEKSKNKERIPTPSTKNTVIVQSRKEINGCRPKQKLQMQCNTCTLTTKMPPGEHDKKHKDWKSLIFGIPFLKTMIGKDPALIITELTQSPSLLKASIVRTSKDEDYLKLFLHVLAEAFKSRATQKVMINLFDALKETGFFRMLENYLVSIIIRISTGKVEEQSAALVLRYALCIAMEQITMNPSSVYIFRKLHALMGQVIDELAKTDSVDDVITIEYQHFSEQKKSIERVKKQCSDRKQDQQQPADDFRQYSVSPTADEITSSVCPSIRPNKVDGTYKDLHDYLDVHFRLLREDFVGPLREGMTQYIHMMKSKKGKQMTEETLRNLDIKVYENVRVHSPVVTQQGLCYKVQIKMTANLRRIEWKFSKRLIYGSMVCLTDMNFKDFLLATVVEREEKDIKRGFFTIHFESEDIATVDILHKVYRMAETTGYFESYRHVLSSLQSFKDGDLPFEKYIVGCKKGTDPPAYLTPRKTYDLRPLVDKNIMVQESSRKQNIKGRPNDKLSRGPNAAKEVCVADLKSWPAKELLHMDKSQYEAVQTALTNEFAIIQGPPGTGKTYIGLQIVKALLHNKSAWTDIGLRNRNRPMLIVCYTNHALDQFLEGILKFFQGNILRVGGRSNSPELEDFNLKKHRNMYHKKGTTLARLKYHKRCARRQMETLSKDVQLLAKTIETYQAEIVKEDVLLPEMGNKLYVDLKHGYRNGDENRKNENERDFSYIVKWLEIEQIEKECMKQLQKEIRTKRTKHVQVDDEVFRMQKERKIDTWEDLHFSANEHDLLRSIQADIAYYVPKPPRRTKNNDVRKRYLKLLNSTIVDMISNEDIMSEEEAQNIEDIWGLNRNAKWRLYRLWIQNLCTLLYEEIEERRETFETASKEYGDALEQLDKEIMRNTSVLGMTTSGAARYQSVLQEIGPKIIVVEEAAEVLEAHIITTLSKGCEHLILIGDHKQLRPNPTVYKLAVKYNLDISLFERMVKNGMKFNCLELQHRMRPEISSVMRHIYPDLKDHEHVRSYANVKGISKNLYLVNHSHLENSDEDRKSYSNLKEAEYAVALCRYLLLQGYENHEITVLTTYTGQLMCLKNLMPKEEFDGVKVTVVDNYQGEENQIVILSLVRSNTAEKIGFLKTENRICVALSRAKVGFFVIGNFDQLARHSDLWNKITKDMKEKNCFGEGLRLYCQNHPNGAAIVAKNHEDFTKAPEGGCSRKCDVRLNCGHKCERFCHVLDQKHETEKSRCEKACMKTCELGHKCLDKCFEECRPCAVPVIKTIPKCKHSQSVLCGVKPEEFSCQAPCELKLKCGHLCKKPCGVEHTSQCLAEINSTWPCGHCAVIKCWETESKLCSNPCGTVLKCGHKCKGTCGICFRGLVHQPCQVKSMRTLYCGHKCEAYCENEPMCPELCRNACDHKKCTKRCRELCYPCQEPCSWMCPHYRCTRLCSEVCNRPRCYKPCHKFLKCKHKCIGLCGDPCPTICRKCDKKTFGHKVFGDKHKPHAKFVLLEDCGHLVEYLTMDKYMLEVEKKNNIRLKCCPMCKTPIRRCRRYGNMIKGILSDIEREKEDATGNISLYFKLGDQIARLTTANSNDLEIYADHEIERFDTEEALASYPCHYYKSLCKKEFFDRLKHLRQDFLTKGKLLTVQKQLKLAMEILDVRQKIVDNDTRTITLESRAEKNFMLFLRRLLLNITRPRDALTMQESEDFSSQMQRGEAYVHLKKMKSEIQSCGKVIKATTDVLKIQLLVLENRKLTQAEEEEIVRGFERLSKLIKIKGIRTTEAKHIRSTEQSSEQWMNCTNKCTCMCTSTSANNACSVDRIQFGNFDFDLMSAGETSGIGINKDENGKCPTDEIQSGDFNLLSANETSNMAIDSDVCPVYSIEDIHFGDFDCSLANKPTLVDT